MSRNRNPARSQPRQSDLDIPEELESFETEPGEFNLEYSQGGDFSDWSLGQSD